MLASLAKIDTAIADLTAKGTSGALTVAGIKATRDSLKADVQTVIDNGQEDQRARTCPRPRRPGPISTAAVTALPDSATLMDAAGVLMTKVGPLTAGLAQIKALVTPTT